MKRLEPILANDVVLDSLDLFAVKLEQSSASCADQVIVVPVFVVVFVQGAPVVRLELPGEPAILKKFESAIYGCEANRRVLGLYQGIEHFARYVTFSIQKHIQYQVALSSLFQPALLKVLMKYAQFLAFHLSVLLVLHYTPVLKT